MMKEEAMQLLLAEQRLTITCTTNSTVAELTRKHALFQSCRRVRGWVLCLAGLRARALKNKEDSY